MPATIKRFYVVRSSKYADEDHSTLKAAKKDAAWIRKDGWDAEILEVRRVQE